jgi:CRISPR system Cascade subunit CasB
MTKTENSWENDFIAAVEKLDGGALARLRRGCGERTPIEGRCPWLIEYIHRPWAEPSAFLVASLMAQYKTQTIKEGGHRLNGNFGVTWKQAVAGTASVSIRRRFTTLLDAEYDPNTGGGDLTYRLRQMVRYAASKDVGVDWPQLLRDVMDWNRLGKRAQKCWARAFFASEPDQKEPQKPAEKEG